MIIEPNYIFPPSLSLFEDEINADAWFVLFNKAVTQNCDSATYEVNTQGARVHCGPTMLKASQ